MFFKLRRIFPILILLIFAIAVALIHSKNDKFTTANSNLICKQESQNYQISIPKDWTIYENISDGKKFGPGKSVEVGCKEFSDTLLIGKKPNFPLRDTIIVKSFKSELSLNEINKKNHSYSLHTENLQLSEEPARLFKAVDIDNNIFWEKVAKKDNIIYKIIYREANDIAIQEIINSFEFI